MSEKRITPGPVAAFKTMGGGIGVCSKRTDALVGDTAKCSGSDGTRSDEECMANAQLYALARKTANELQDLGYDPFVVLERLPELIELLGRGRWYAGVYHNRGKRPVDGARLRIDGCFSSKAGASDAAKKAISCGWVGTNIVNQDTAKPSIVFELSAVERAYIGDLLTTLREKEANQ